jgi:hypothetical protein
MKCIRVKYLPATNTKGSRFVADDGDGNRATVGYDSALGDDERPLEAVRALCAKMNWKGRVVLGYMGHERIYTWISADGRDTYEI